jgi:hypothetical protein
VVGPTISQTVGSSGKASTDLWKGYCGTGARSFTVSVMDRGTSSASVVSTQTIISNNSTPLSIDSVPGDTNFSPKVTLARRTGQIYVKVNINPVKLACNKNSDRDDDDEEGDDNCTQPAMTAKNYTLNYLCKDAKGKIITRGSKMVMNRDN